MCKAFDNVNRRGLLNHINKSKLPHKEPSNDSLTSTNHLQDHSLSPDSISPKQWLEEKQLELSTGQSSATYLLCGKKKLTSRYPSTTYPFSPTKVKISWESHAGVQPTHYACQKEATNQVLCAEQTWGKE